MKLASLLLAAAIVVIAGCGGKVLVDPDASPPPDASADAKKPWDPRDHLDECCNQYTGSGYPEIPGPGPGLCQDRHATKCPKNNYCGYLPLATT